MLPDVTVGVQRGREVVDVHPAAGGEVRWLLDATVAAGSDLRGPYVHGPRGGRFLYLVWLRSGEMFRRAKLMLDPLPDGLRAEAPDSWLDGRIGLSMPDGSPVCAAVRPPALGWRLR